MFSVRFLIRLIAQHKLMILFSAYHVQNTSVKWSLMFSLMEEAKQRLSIADYTLGQTTLEQVFLFFTKYQRDAK